LDEANQDNFLEVLFEQVRAYSSTLLMVSHNPRLSEGFDRVLHMSEIVNVERALV